MTKRAIFVESEEFLQREGLTHEPAVWEDGLRTDTGRGTFEWWYFDAHFDDGSTAVMVYATKSLLLRSDPLTPMVALTITRTDGVRLSAHPLLYPPSQFEAAQDGCQVRIGPSQVSGDLHRYELHTQGKDWAADLTFTGIAPPWRPGTGKTYYDEALSRYFAWLVPIPYGQVEGTLTYDGKTHAVRGNGYHDHNWGNLGLERVISHWFWGRAHLGNFTVIFVEITSTQDYGYQKTPIFMLAKGDRLLADQGQSFTLEIADLQDHPSGKRYPRTLDFHWQSDQGIAHIALRQPRLIDSFSLLDDIPGWKRWLARRFANPYYFRFDTDMELTVDLAGTRAVERGSSIYEYMMLH